MRFDLVRPCPKCPFRTDIDGYLRRERAPEIAYALADGATFACHQTTVDDGDDGLVEGPDSQFCAGAMIALERQNAPNQILRIAERLGGYDPAKLVMDSPVVSTFAEFVSRQEPDEPDGGDCCSVCGPDCEAPAGYLVGGIAIPASDGGELYDCDCCGEPVCGSCSTDSGICRPCAGDDDYPLHL